MLTFKQFEKCFLFQSVGWSTWCEGKWTKRLHGSQAYVRLSVRLHCRPELSETTQTWNWCNGRVSLDKGTRQCWPVCISSDASGRKRFFFCYSLWQLCFVVHCCENKANSWVWRSSIVADSIKGTFHEGIEINLVMCRVLFDSVNWFQSYTASDISCSRGAMNFK